MSETEKEMWEKAKEFTFKYITPHAHELEKKNDFPMEVVQKAYEHGLMNLHIPKEAGGPAHSLLTEALVSEATGYGCAGISTSTTVCQDCPSTCVNIADRRAAILCGLNRSMDP